MKCIHSAHFQISRGVGLFSGSLILSPGFHWIPSHLLTAFCELCLFQVQRWLTHSSRVITSRLTRHCLVHYTVNETCSEGGHFREIPLKRGYPRCRGNPPMSPSPNCPCHSQTRPAHMWNPLCFSYSFPLLFWRSGRVLFSMPRHCGTYGSNSFQTAGKSITLFPHHYSTRCWSCYLCNSQAKHAKVLVHMLTHIEGMWEEERERRKDTKIGWKSGRAIWGSW